MTAWHESNSPADEAIEDAAALWLAEREEGFPAGRAAEFEQWRQADPRHVAAVARLQAACGLLRQMPIVRAELTARAVAPAGWSRSSGLTRRLPFFIGLAAAVALAALGAWRLAPPAPAPHRYVAAATAEHVTLADGSAVELNANSRMEVNFNAAERRVALLAGEAHFTVAKNPARPFIVRAGDVAVRAVGTAFNVRLGPAAIEVLVTEGRVHVAEAARVNSAPLAAPLLHAGQRAVIELGSAGAAPRIEEVEPAAMRAALAWQDARLEFSDTPLAEVVVRFNRRNHVQLVLGDPELAQRPVGGTFRADNVEGFVRLLETSRDVTTERRTGSEIVLRAVK